MNGTMGNPQEMLDAYIAGLFEGEGSFCATRIRRKRGYVYRFQADISNTDPEIIKKYIEFCKIHGLSYYVRADVRKSKKHKTCYQVQISSKKDRRRFVEIIGKHLVGKKIEEMKLGLELLDLNDAFLESRERDKLGRYQDTEQDPRIEQIYYEMKRIKRSSETTREAPIIFG